MIHFIKMCQRGEDLKKDERKKAFHECIPYYDGEWGKRNNKNIINDIEVG
jgi:hypothetical protein